MRSGMRYSRKLGPPIVSAAIATIVLTNFAIATIVRGPAGGSVGLFHSIWPIALTSAVAVILVMSTLYHALVELVQELEEREAAAQHAAVHDQLTGLANRALLEDRLGQALGRLRRDGEKSALLVLDLDRFKQVNDTLGHAAGDLLVQQVAERLLALLRDTDTVARIGGDEFAILQASCRNEADVHRLCARVIDAIREPFSVIGREVRVGVSVGAVLLDRKDEDAGEVIRKGDITMYRAKSAGRDCYRVFSDEMDATVQRRNRVEQRLRQAIEEERGLELHFQPQIDSAGAVVAVEGLLRWEDSELGVVPPSEILPIASETNLIDSLGEFTFRQACAAARSCPSLIVGLNLSPLQARRQDLPARLAEIAREEGVPCSQIELEMTESLMIEHSEICEIAVADLRAHGFRIALDDFGTGYSSLSYLRRFEVDKVKLDRSFIRSAGADRSIAIIRAAVTLGHALGLQVVAEGISTAEQEQIALEAGCDLLQGRRYSWPLPLAKLRPFLKKWDEGRSTAAA